MARKGLTLIVCKRVRRPIGVPLPVIKLATPQHCVAPRPFQPRFVTAAFVFS